jgi:hypothetical protein
MLVAEQESDRDMSLKVGRKFSGVLRLLCMLTSSQRNNSPSRLNDSQFFQGLLGIAKVCESHHEPPNGVEVGKVRPLDALEFPALLNIRYFTEEKVRRGVLTLKILATARCDRVGVTPSTANARLFGAGYIGSTLPRERLGLAFAANRGLTGLAPSLRRNLECEAVIGVGRPE